MAEIGLVVQENMKTWRLDEDNNNNDDIYQTKMTRKPFNMIRLKVLIFKNRFTYFNIQIQKNTHTKEKTPTSTKNPHRDKYKHMCIFGQIIDIRGNFTVAFFSFLMPDVSCVS